MGARWNWEAVCKKGHDYGNFSGGADDCYECGAEPLVVFDGDDASEQRAAWKLECHEVSRDGQRCERRANHSSPHRGKKIREVLWDKVEW